MVRVHVVYLVVIFSFGSVATAQSFALDQIHPTADDLQRVTDAREFGPDNEYEDVGNGLRLHRSCMYSVPDGTVAVGRALYSLSDGQLLRRFDKCRFLPRRPLDPPPTVNGWVLGSFQNPSSGGSLKPWFTGISGRWLVPYVPDVCGASVRYWFNGLQGSNEIIQPVLRYSAGYWCWYNMANWNVFSDGTAYYGPAEFVYPGSTIDGYVQKLDVQCTGLDNGTGCYYRVGYAVDNSAIRWTTFFVSGMMNQAVGAALEGYYLNVCSEWPHGPTVFTSTLVSQAVTGSGIWNQPGVVVNANMSGTNFGGVPACSYGISVQNVGSYSTTTLNYNP